DRLDGAEATAARALVAEHHERHRRVRAAPALADVRATRLLADGVEVEPARQVEEPCVSFAARSADLEPGRFSDLADLSRSAPAREAASPRRRVAVLRSFGGRSRDASGAVHADESSRERGACGKRRPGVAQAIVKTVRMPRLARRSAKPSLIAASGRRA